MGKGRGKRLGTNSGRYGLSFFSMEGQHSLSKDRALKKRNPEKYKRRKKIAKFSADGKITSKEAKKLIKRGISMDKVLNQNIKEYRKAQKYADKFNIRRFGRDQTAGKGMEMPNFQPLKIKNKARERFMRDLLDLDKKPERQPKPKPKAIEEDQPVSIPKPVDEPEPEITEEAVREKVPTTPYYLGKPLNTIRNPRGNIRGGIGQFAQQGGVGSQRQFKSKLLNV